MADWCRFRLGRLERPDAVDLVGYGSNQDRPVENQREGSMQSENRILGVRERTEMFLKKERRKN